MKREIKFRGWNAKNKRWIYGFYLQNRGAHFVCPDEFANGKSWEDYEAIPETVGQFTGLLDKNGREIYEGDILDTPISDGMIVVFGTGSFHINTISGAIHYFDAWMDKIDEFEVVGNIHDNTELLKGGEK